MKSSVVFALTCGWFGEVSHSVAARAPVVLVSRWQLAKRRESGWHECHMQGFAYMRRSTIITMIL